MRKMLFFMICFALVAGILFAGGKKGGWRGVVDRGGGTGSASGCGRQDDSSGAGDQLSDSQQVYFLWRGPG